MQPLHPADRWPPAVGERLRISIAPPGGKAMRVQATLLAVEAGRELRWRCRLLVPGLFDGEHFFILSPGDGGAETRVEHGERFSRLRAGLMGAASFAGIEQGFAAMNEALKQRVEMAASGR